MNEKVIEFLSDGIWTKTELSEKLGISRVTLDTRLEKGNWKKAEVWLLNSIVKKASY